MPQKKTNPFKLADPDKAAKALKGDLHYYGKDGKVLCVTDTKGHANPDESSLTRIVVDSSEGVIPLWAPQTTLRWRFQERSLLNFQHPKKAKQAIRKILAEGILAWGDWRPIRFAERNDRWDFELVVRPRPDCDINGCVLASAFFPDPGRHELVLYPTMFETTRKEMVATMAHELGHIFGLRHFFANVSEASFPSEIFGQHNRFSIMNYGSKSVMTQHDQEDLKTLYQKVWREEIKEINNTPIKLMEPFSTQGTQPGDPVFRFAPNRF